MMKSAKHPIFLKSIIGVATIFFLSSQALKTGLTEKSDFLQASGEIVYLEKTFQELPNRSEGKYRYLQINNYDKVFELFIGKDAGDFKPKYERLDQLKTGDTITVYFDEDKKEKDVRLNRLAMFIDKENDAYFIRGKFFRTFGMVGFGFGFLLLAVICILKFKNIIA